MPGHLHEVLSVDWDKYTDVIATASVDTTIATWDIRNPGKPLQKFHGHNMAIRRVKFSPFESNVLASASYDMSVNIWDTNTP